MNLESQIIKNKKEIIVPATELREISVPVKVQKHQHIQ